MESFLPLRSLASVNKFPGKIIEKTQLKRFLGCLNYVLDFYLNLSKILQPWHDRLKKNLKPWT